MRAIGSIGDRGISHDWSSIVLRLATIDLKLGTFMTEKVVPAVRDSGEARASMHLGR